MFAKFRKTNIAHRKTDEALYAVIAQEMETSRRSSGLWIKALEKADGNKERQVAEYIKLRVQSLKDDINIHSELSGVQKRVAHDPDVDEFVALLGSGAPIEEIKQYVSGLGEQELHKFVNQADACEEYPIHAAVKENRPNITEWLLQSGANPNLRNYWGSTALEIAEKKKNQEVILVLDQYLARPQLSRHSVTS